MIGFVPDRWQALRERYANLPDLETQWAMRIHTDSDGMVVCRPLLSGDVTTYGSEIMAELQRRGEWTR